jgi:hypothetical protein
VIGQAHKVATHLPVFLEVMKTLRTMTPSTESLKLLF